MVARPAGNEKWMARPAFVGAAVVWYALLLYADLPKLRASGTNSQLDIARVFAVRKSKSALPILFCEISAGPEARAVPVSGLHMRQVRAPGCFAWTTAGQQSYRAGALSEAALTGRRDPTD
jgi:hypothetical protein